MYDYIIASHGAADYNRSTQVLPNVSVLFYQRFGAAMLNQVGLALQSAIVNPGHPNAASVIKQYPARALWNGNQQGNAFQPELRLTGEAVYFKSGIVCAATNEVVFNLAPDASITLSEAIAIIRAHADKTFTQGCDVRVHCLFCL